MGIVVKGLVRFCFVGDIMPMGRLYGLDALRGIAAWIVLLMHVSGGLAGGHLAVDFFFMLSGYVMARTYEHRLQAGTLTASAFLAKRIRRLWPIMAVGASLGLLLHLHVNGPSADLAWAYIFALFLVPAGQTVPYMLNLPAWSIFYELLANALHGRYFVRLSNRHLIVVLGLAAGVFAGSFAIVGFPRILRVTSLEMQFFVIFRALVAYIIGVLLFRLVKDRPPVRVPFWIGAALLPAYVALVAAYPFPLWPLPFIFLVAPIMIFAGLGDDVPKRVAAILGDLSFPLYAVHFPIMQAVDFAGYNPLVSIVASIAVASLWLIPRGQRVPTPSHKARYPG